MVAQLGALLDFAAATLQRWYELIRAELALRIAVNKNQNHGSGNIPCSIFRVR
jgi:hypothetical protein